MSEEKDTWVEEGHIARGTTYPAGAESVFQNFEVTP